jgi:hypothetical protein
MKVELGLVIAERNIKATLSDDRESIVTVRLGAPSETQDLGSVSAPYQIQFEDKTRTFRAVGIDGFQALQLAMRMIEVELESLEREYHIKMSKDENVNLGFRYY